MRTKIMIVWCHWDRDEALTLSTPNDAHGTREISSAEDAACVSGSPSLSLSLSRHSLVIIFMKNAQVDVNVP